MQYGDFLRKLGETALKYADMTEEETNGFVLDVVDDNGLSASKSIVQQVSFDSNGDWFYEVSLYCPINVDANAHVENAPNGSVFDIYIDTNYSEHKEFKGIVSGQNVSVTLKTNVFSKTKFKFHIHSNKPNSSATFNVQCSL